MYQILFQKMDLPQIIGEFITYDEAYSYMLSLGHKGTIKDIGGYHMKEIYNNEILHYEIARCG